MTSIVFRFCLLSHQPPQSLKLRRHQGKHDGDCRPLQKRQRVDGLRPMACSLRPLVYGLWPMAYGLRPSAFGFINQNTQVLLSNFIGTPSIEKVLLYCEEVHKYYFMNHKSEADQLQQRNQNSRPIKHKLNQNKVTHLLPPQLLQAKTCSRFSGIFVKMKHEELEVSQIAQIQLLNRGLDIQNLSQRRPVTEQ